MSVCLLRIQSVMASLKRLVLTNIRRLLWLLYLVCMNVFFYLIFSYQYWHHWFQDDLNIAGPFLLTILIGGTSLVLKCNGYVVLYGFSKLSCVVRKYGWFGLVLYALFVGFFSYFFVTVALDYSLFFGWGLTQKHLVSQMEKNIIHIGDERLHSDRDGSGLFLRYEGEDVELEYRRVILWKSNSRPTNDELMNMLWRLNNKPITWSDRHIFDVTWTELSYDEKINILNLIAKRMSRYYTHVTSQLVLDSVMATWDVTASKVMWERLNMYRVVTKLQIKLLKASDFGEYTWSDAVLRGYVRNSQYFLQKKNWCHQLIYENQLSNSTLCKMEYKFHKYRLKLLSIAIFTMTYDLPRENKTAQRMSLIRFSDRKIRIALAPGAIVHATTSYWQIERDKNEVAVDYLINQRSIRILTSVWHCSKLLLLYYWMSAGEYCRRNAEICVPPSETSLKSYRETGRAKVGTFTFCLGPEFFGLWEAEFDRHYYNSSTKQYELVSVAYPVKIYFQPKKQNLVSDLLFHNESSSYAPQEWNASDWNPTDLELQMTGQLAHAETQCFQVKECVFIIVLILLSVVVIIGLSCVVIKIGTLSKKLFLRMPVSLNHTPEHKDTEAVDPREVSERNYDIFLSVCQTDAGGIGESIADISETLKQRVFFPARDAPPNKPELSVIDEAVESSKRFIIFFSEHYLQENRLFEAEIIVDSVTQRGQNFPKTILVVKLDFSELPRSLKRCAIVDCTLGELTEYWRRNLKSWIIDGSTCSRAEFFVLALVQSLIQQG